MNKASPYSMCLSFLILSISSVSGIAVTWKLTGGSQHINFLYFSTIVQSLIFLAQSLVYWKAREEIYYQLLYLAAFSLTMIWVMLCLFLPILWVASVNVEVKSFLVCGFLLITVANFTYATKHIREKWMQAGAATFEKLFDQSRKMVDWDTVATEMKIRPVLYVPGVPNTWSTSISVGLAASMFIALNIRNAYPAIAAIAGGVPSAVIASFFVQMCGYYFAQACKIAEVEKEKKVTIKCSE